MKHVIWPRPFKDPIKKAPGFEKKQLAVYKIDLMPFCQFACAYCSTNCGNYLRINTPNIKEWTFQQLGESLNPRQHADQFFMTFKDPVAALSAQLRQYPKLSKAEGVLQFGMTVDNFSPTLVSDGVTFACLEILLKQTKFRIRILSKSSAVARPEFVKLFQEYPGRVTVGMSAGSLKDGIMRFIEVGTSAPTGRAIAARRLQDQGISTFGMFCPVLPGLDQPEAVEELYRAFNAGTCSEIWAEPYNDRQNWRHLHDRLPNDELKAALTAVMTDKRAWARYALELARTHAAILERQGFVGKSTFLLYQSHMTADEIAEAATIPGVLFQSKQDEEQ